MERREEVTDILKSMFPITKDIDHIGLISDNVIDSVGIVELIDILENKYDVEFEMEDITASNFDSVESILELIDARRGE